MFVLGVRVAPLGLEKEKCLGKINLHSWGCFDVFRVLRYLTALSPNLHR